MQTWVWISDSYLQGLLVAHRLELFLFSITVFDTLCLASSNSNIQLLLSCFQLCSVHLKWHPVWQPFFLGLLLLGFYKLSCRFIGIFIDPTGIIFPPTCKAEMLIEEDVMFPGKLFVDVSQLIRNTCQALNLKKKLGRLCGCCGSILGGREPHFSFQRHLLYFSVALFYLHNLGLLILFLFCVDNCFVVSALTLSDSAFGWLTAKSIGRW